MNSIGITLKSWTENDFYQND